MQQEKNTAYGKVLISEDNHHQYPTSFACKTRQIQDNSPQTLSDELHANNVRFLSEKVIFVFT